ncbi:MAG: hypothetical protein ACI9FJ_001799, partial [Alteromonadaceae bacterium]
YRGKNADEGVLPIIKKARELLSAPELL